MKFIPKTEHGKLEKVQRGATKRFRATMIWVARKAWKGVD